jgi:hypothetical protein
MCSKSFRQARHIKQLGKLKLIALLDALKSALENLGERMKFELIKNYSGLMS